MQKEGESVVPGFMVVVGTWAVKPARQVMSIRPTP